MAGRSFVCALIPSLFSLASLICLLMVILGGVSNQRQMMTIHTKDLSISSSEAANLANIVGRGLTDDRPSILPPNIPLARRFNLSGLLGQAKSVSVSARTIYDENSSIVEIITQTITARDIHRARGTMEPLLTSSPITSTNSILRRGQEEAVMAPTTVGPLKERSPIQTPPAILAPNVPGSIDRRALSQMPEIVPPSMPGGVGRRDIPAPPDLIRPEHPMARRQIDLSSLADGASSLLGTKATDIASIASSVASANPAISSLATTAENIAKGANITAKDLGLADEYQIFLWNYCAVTGKDRKCSDRKFNWAAETLNTSKLEDTAKSIGVTIDLPKDLTSALKTFSTVDKWTQVAYIIAIVATAITFISGLAVLVGNLCNTCYSGTFPCLTHIISWVATIAILASSILATVLVYVSTKAMNGTTKAYGVQGEVNTSFLSVTWLAFAFALGATLTWAFAACCCHSQRREPTSTDGYQARSKTYGGLAEKFGLARSPNRDSEEGQRLTPTDYNRNSTLSTTTPAIPQGGLSPYIEQTPRMSTGGGKQYSPLGTENTAYGQHGGEYPMAQLPPVQQGPSVFAGIGGYGNTPQRSQTGEGYEGYRHEGFRG